MDILPSLSKTVWYGYKAAASILLISSIVVGVDISCSSIGINIETLQFGIPTPWPSTLPTIIP